MQTTTTHGVTITAQTTDKGLISFEMNYNGETSIADTLDPSEAAELGRALIHLSNTTTTDGLSLPLPLGTIVLRIAANGRTVGQTRFKITGWLPNKRRYILEEVSDEQWPKHTETTTWPADSVHAV